MNDEAVGTVGPHVVLPPAVIDGQQAAVLGDDAHHLARVLRVGVGDPVSVTDGVGGLWQARVADVGREVRLSLGARADIPAPTPAVHVVQALPKQRKFDDVVRMLTEVGVAVIHPATTTRGEVDPPADRADRALARWRAVASAATKQSRRAWLPTLTPVQPWAEAIDAAHAPGTLGLVCWEEAVTPLGRVLGDEQPERLLLAIGPEGGLTADEVAASGLPAVTLGATVLRTETAAIVAVSAALALLGRFS